jgi:hypothetical protein
MATLTNGHQTITVPDEAAGAYFEEGWHAPGNAVAEQKPAKRRSPRREKTPKHDEGE